MPEKLKDNFYVYEELAEKNFGKNAFIWWIKEANDLIYVCEGSEKSIFVLDENLKEKSRVELNYIPFIIDYKKGIFAVSFLRDGKVGFFDRDFKKLEINLDGIDRMETTAFFFGDKKSYLMDFVNNLIIEGVFEGGKNFRGKKEIKLTERYFYNKNTNQYDLRVLSIMEDKIYCGDKNGIIYEILENGEVKEYYRPYVHITNMNFWKIKNGVYYAIDFFRNSIIAEKMDEEKKYKVRKIKNRRNVLRMERYKDSIIYSSYTEDGAVLKRCRF